MRRRAFTWTELIVIVLVLFIVCALATPVFLHAREAAGRSRCLSNLRSISTALHAYADSHSATFPLSIPADTIHWYPNREPAVPATSDIDRIFWANAIDVDADTLNCPAVTGFPFNYNGYMHGVSTRRIAKPNDTIAVWEGSGKGGNARSLPRLNCMKTNEPCGYFEGTATISEIPDGSAWTHGRGANFLLLDGHAKWRRLGENAGVQTNSASDPFHVYDHGGHVDKFWLNDKGQAILFMLD